jgi:hypothetical protein
MKRLIIIAIMSVAIGAIACHFLQKRPTEGQAILEYGDSDSRYRYAQDKNLSPYAIFGDSSVVLLTEAERYGRQFIEIFNMDRLSEVYRIEFDQKSAKIRFYDKSGDLLKEELLDPEMIARFLSVDPRADKYYGWSPYNYVLGNPIRNTDPRGDTVRIGGANGNFDWTPGASYNGNDNFIAQSVSALNALTAAPSTASFTFYTKDRSVVQGNAILDYVGEGSLASSLIMIKEGAAGKSRHESGTVYWMPTEGIQMENFTTGLMGSVPPMAILLHEMGHGWLEHTYGDAQLSIMFANEEQMIIDRLESKASTSLGFGRRDNHYNVRSNRAEALNQDLHMNDPRFPANLRQNRTFKYYYQTQSPITTRSGQ